MLRVRSLIKVFIVSQLILEITSQNDDNRDQEWTVDDPRWESKIPNWWDEEHFVPPVGPIAERSQNFWINHGQNLLEQKINQKFNLNKAKNVVIFIGDGMGLSTLMATRSYISDVQTELSFEKFPFTGLSKPYCINYQVPDSSCTSSAILTGVKNNYGTMGVNGNVNLRNCTAQRDNTTHLDSIFKHAQNAGKATGFVTTTRITHATPAASYANTASRYWESNENTPDGCRDIAYQLIHGEIGSKFDVVMGGGKRHFLPNSDGTNGWRTDNRNLINEYLEMQQSNNNRAELVTSRAELLTINATTIDKVLGFFADSHMEYKLLADTNQPTLMEMTAKSLEILKKNANGFVLLVEGGRIDTAHHATTAKLAIDETVEFHKTVEYVKSITSDEDTLIIVTADHSNVLTVGGYPPRGFNILGPGDFSRTDQMWFYTLSYASGPGYSDHQSSNGGRQNPRGQKYTNPSFRQPTTVPEPDETHAGEDVGVYASGPYAHLFSGVYEQSYIAHALMYATCLGSEDFKKNPQCTDGASVKIASFWMFAIAVIISIMNY